MNTRPTSGIHDSFKENCFGHGGHLRSTKKNLALLKTFPLPCIYNSFSLEAWYERKVLSKSNFMLKYAQTLKNPLK